MATLSEHIEANLDRFGEKHAFRFWSDDVHYDDITFAQIWQQSDSLACVMAERVRPGDRCLLLFPPGIALIIAMNACLKTGAVAVLAYPPATPALTEKLNAICYDADAKLLLTETTILDKIKQLKWLKRFDVMPGTRYCLSQRMQKLLALANWPLDTLPMLAIDTCLNNTSVFKRPALRTDSLAILQYTSGSTGEPKGIMVSHANIMDNLSKIERGFELSAQDIACIWLPPYHDMGLYAGIIQPMYTFYTTHLMLPQAFIKNPLTWLKIISSQGVTSSGGPNFAFQYCADRITTEQVSQLSLGQWTNAFCGSEPIQKKTVEQFCAHFAPAGFLPSAFRACYGMAETTVYVSITPRDTLPKTITVNHNGNEQTVFSCGRTEFDVKIVSPEDKRLCTDGEIGEVWLASNSVTQGYWQNPEKTASTFQATRAESSAPYLRTGDYGLIQSGELYITGRLKDLIIIAGRNYYPHDIEANIAAHVPSISDSKIVAIALPGTPAERLCIACIANKQQSHESLAAAIKSAVSQRLQLVVDTVLILPKKSIPLTTSGKKRRQVFRKRYLNGEITPLNIFTHTKTDVTNTDQRPQSLDPKRIEQNIQAIIQSTLGTKEPPDTRLGFFDMGLDSMMAVAISEKIEHDLQLSCPVETLFQHPSIKQLAHHLATPSASYDTIAMTTCASASQQAISIIGMACRFPDTANNCANYWELLINSQSALHPISDDRAARIDFTYRDDVPSVYGLIAQVDAFDHTFFNISAKEAELMDPQQRLILETAWHALEDAGIVIQDGRKVGIFVGMQHSEYASKCLQHTEARESIYAATGNASSVAAGRLAYFLGVQGPTMAIDTACSSALVALHEACQHIRLGHCHTAIVATSQLIISPENLTLLAHAGMLSPDGQCKTFDARADGYARSEGVAAIIISDLKHKKVPLATIKASFINQDGASSGLTVPNGAMQIALMTACLKQAQLSVNDIDYIECHGTGTQLGDPIEIAAIRSVYAQRDKHKPLLLGSVKSNIGHLEASAGMAGLIKVLLSLQHDCIPANLNFSTCNPRIDCHDPPLKICTSHTPWPRTDTQARRAAISSFGFSGTNAQVIIEENRAPAAKPTVEQATDDTHVLLISARSRLALANLIAAYQVYLAHTTHRFCDIAYSARITRRRFEHHITIRAKTTRAALEQLINQTYELDDSVEDHTLDTAHGRQIVTLPHYPFDRHQHWLTPFGSNNTLTLAYYEHCWSEVFINANQNQTAFNSMIWLVEDNTSHRVHEDLPLTTLSLANALSTALPQSLGMVLYTDIDPCGLLALLKKLDGHSLSHGVFALVPENDRYRFASVMGIMQALYWEAPQLNAKIIMTVAPPPLTDLLQIACTDAQNLLYTGGNWQQMTIEPIALPQQTPSSSLWQGVHWITGGTGGLGLKLAAWLVAQGVRSLILSSRSGLNDDNATEINTLKNCGVAVDVVKLDASDACAVRIFGQNLKKQHVPLTGIYHLAGVEISQRFQDITPACFNDIYAGKADGARHLDTLSQQFNIKLFVLFSSFSAFIGSPFQAAYCAANRCLDELASLRQQQHQAITCINWGGIGSVGMAVREHSLLNDDDLIPCDAMFDALAHAIASHRHRIAIIHPNALEHMLEFFDHKPHWINPYHQPEHTDDNKDNYATLSLTEIREKVAHTLINNILPNAGVHSIDQQVSLSALMIDSLQAVSMTLSIKKSLHVILSPSDFLSSDMTIEAFIEHISQQLFNQRQPDTKSLAHKKSLSIQELDKNDTVSWHELNQIAQQALSEHVKQVSATALFTFDTPGTHILMAHHKEQIVGGIQITPLNRTSEHYIDEIIDLDRVFVEDYKQNAVVHIGRLCLLPEFRASAYYSLSLLQGAVVQRLATENKRIVIVDVPCQRVNLYLQAGYQSLISLPLFTEKDDKVKSMVLWASTDELRRYYEQSEHCLL